MKIRIFFFVLFLLGVLRLILSIFSDFLDRSGRISMDKKPWDLLPVELHPGDDKTQIDEFSQAMLEKWNKGREEHGLAFWTDPFEEAMKECLDGALYFKVIYFRIKALKERVSGNDTTSS
jgi:hypothetical protein